MSTVVDRTAQVKALAEQIRKLPKQSLSRWLEQGLFHFRKFATDPQIHVDMTYWMLPVAAYCDEMPEANVDPDAVCSLCFAGATVAGACGILPADVPDLAMSILPDELQFLQVMDYLRLGWIADAVRTVVTCSIVGDGHPISPATVERCLELESNPQEIPASLDCGRYEDDPVEWLRRVEGVVATLKELGL